MAPSGYVDEASAERAVAKIDLDHGCRARLGERQAEVAGGGFGLGAAAEENLTVTGRALDRPSMRHGDDRNRLLHPPLLTTGMPERCRGGGARRTSRIDPALTINLKTDPLLDNREHSE
jgi:hypothetical protein